VTARVKQTGAYDSQQKTKSVLPEGYNYSKVTKLTFKYLIFSREFLKKVFQCQDTQLMFLT